MSKKKLIRWHNGLWHQTSRVQILGLLFTGYVTLGKLLKHSFSSSVNVKKVKYLFHRVILKISVITYKLLRTIPGILKFSKNTSHYYNLLFFGKVFLFITLWYQCAHNKHSYVGINMIISKSKTASY